MRVLLDTHVLIWLLEGDKNLINVMIASRRGSANDRLATVSSANDINQNSFRLLNP
jgi:PIN domain nuclease of toxin-antitoxin system